jgi:hypothetical protein
MTVALDRNRDEDLKRLATHVMSLLYKRVSR